MNKTSISWVRNPHPIAGTGYTWNMLAERFWLKVDRSAGNDACWPWLAYRSPKGYGRFFANAKMWLAHAVAWRIENGDPPTGLFVLHRCDNPSCCNPGHLFLGTIADNNHDMVAKGRHGSTVHPESRPRGDRHPARLHPERLARAERNGSRLHPDRLARGEHNGACLHPEKLPRGEGHGLARLTEAAVRQAREMSRGGKSQRAIASILGVSQGTIANVLLGRTWRHVDG